MLASFDHSCYLISVDGLCCLVTDRVPDGPLHLRIKTTDTRWLPSAGSQWLLQDRQLVFPQCRLELQHTRQWQPPPAPDSYPDRSTFEHLGNAISLKLAPLSAPVKAGSLASEQLLIERGSAALTNWLAKPADARGTPGADMLSLIGCGQGLTPAGDDILLGTLVALLKTRPSDGRQLAGWVDRNIENRTGLISAAHLKCACDGMAIEPLHCLINCCLQNDCSGITKAIEQLAAYGHSSGYFAACGVALAVRHQA